LGKWHIIKVVIVFHRSSIKTNLIVTGTTIQKYEKARSISTQSARASKEVKIW
jgi:hypothetical protein